MKKLSLKILIASMVICSAASADPAELQCGTDIGKNVDIKLIQSQDTFFDDCWRIQLTCTSGVVAATATFNPPRRSFYWNFDFSAVGEPFPYGRECRYSGEGGVSNTDMLEVACHFAVTGKAEFRARKVPKKVCK
jgi:hypothetical protein